MIQDSGVLPNQIRDEAVYKLISQYSLSGICLSKDNILNMLTVNCCERELDVTIQGLMNAGLVVCENDYLYCSSCTKDESSSKVIIKSKDKIHKAEKALIFFSKIGIVKFIGITGSNTFTTVCAEDDVDILVIVKKNTLFTSRLILHLLTYIFGVLKTHKSKNVRDRICANVLLEEDNLTVPYPKRNLFSAREMAQMVKFYDKDDTFSRFVTANKKWCTGILPNSFRIYEKVQNNRSLKSDVPFLAIKLINNLLYIFQIWYMKAKVTNEIITKKQLWLHPNTRHKFV